jgi:endoglucanase
VDNTAVSQNGFLSVKGTSLVNEKGQPVVLRGISFGWHNWWPRFYNEPTVTWLKNDWNCGLIRAAIGVEPSEAYIQNPETALKCLYSVVDAAIKNDMYVIVDWHSHNIRLREAQEFFQTVATKYKDYPNIIYEIFNEPERQSWSDVKAYSEQVIKTIRTIDPKNIILVGSPEWSQSVDKPAADPIKGYNNLVYSLHFYAATHKQWLRDRATEAIQKGIPIFVSECAGMEASGDGPINRQEWQAWLQWMDEHQISWATWSLADKNETCSMIKNTSSPVSGWTNDDLKEWGLMVRQELKKGK